MPKNVLIRPDTGPNALPFSQAIEANGLVFLAGQIGDAPGSDGPVPGGMQAEARAMLENVGRLLRAVGLDYRDVVKCTVYITDFADFAGMNSVYRRFFPTEMPTRATVQVGALALGATCEIDVMAAR